MFPTLTLNQFNGPYNLFKQDLFPGMTKNVLLTLIYILIIVCMFVYIYAFIYYPCIFILWHLNERLIVQVVVFSGRNHLIIHEGVGPFMLIRTLPFQKKNKTKQKKKLFNNHA